MFAFALLVAVWAGDMGALVVYFGLIFSLECLAMICPVSETASDELLNGWGSCFRKSWKYKYNLIIQFTTVMFLMFVITCVILLNVKPTGVTDDDKIIPVAITIGVMISGATVLFTGTRRVTYALSFWLLFFVVAFLEIPFPSWLNVFGGLLAAFFVTFVLDKLFNCFMKAQELHEHLAIGMGLVFSIYSLFDDWRYWYSRPYKEYAPLMGMSVGAGLFRMIYRYMLKRCSPDPHDIALTNGSPDGPDDVSEDDDEFEYDRQKLLVRSVPISQLRGHHQPTTRART